MTDFKAVGAAVPRGEGSGKVSGQTIYAADVKLPGLLRAELLRSPHPHARIRRIDISKAEKLPGWHGKKATSKRAFARQIWSWSIPSEFPRVTRAIWNHTRRRSRSNPTAEFKS